MSDKNDAILADIAQSLACISHALDRIVERLPEPPKVEPAPVYVPRPVEPYIREDKPTHNAIHSVMDSATDKAMRRDEFVTCAIELMPAPSGRDTRRQNIRRTLDLMARQEGAPFTYRGDLIVFAD